MFIQIQNYLINTDDVKCIAHWPGDGNDKRARIVVTYKNGAYNSFEYEFAGKSMAEFDAIRSALSQAVSISLDQLARSLA